MHYVRIDASVNAEKKVIQREGNLHQIGSLRRKTTITGDGHVGMLEYEPDTTWHDKTACCAVVRGHVEFEHIC